MWSVQIIRDLDRTRLLRDISEQLNGYLWRVGQRHTHTHIPSLWSNVWRTLHTCLCKWYYGTELWQMDIRHTLVLNVCCARTVYIPMTVKQRPAIVTNVNNDYNNHGRFPDHWSVPSGLYYRRLDMYSDAISAGMRHKIVQALTLEHWYCGTHSSLAVCPTPGR